MRPQRFIDVRTIGHGTAGALFGAALFLSVAASCPPPKPPTPGLRSPVSVHTQAATDSAPLTGVRVRLSRGPSVQLEELSDVNGDVTFPDVLYVDTLTHITADRADLQSFAHDYDWGNGDPHLHVPLTALRPPLPTRADTKRYRGFLGNLRDSAGRIIWGSALPGATPAVRDEWLHTIAAQGGTHVPIGWFDPGKSYNSPEIKWENPDWTNDPAAIRGLIDTIQGVRGADGKALRPVIFTHGWGPGTAARAQDELRRNMAVLNQAVAGLDPNTYIVVPAGWEPDGLRGADFDFAFGEWHRLQPNGIQMLHCWLIGNFLSRCLETKQEPGDPWQGDEAAFFQPPHNGQYVEMVGIELPHGRDLFTPCGRTEPKTVNGVAGFAYPATCWKNRADDYVARIGAGFCSDDIGHGSPCGWRKLTFVWLETVTYDVFWNGRNAVDARDIADQGRELCTYYGVDCGWGDGLPR